MRVKQLYKVTMVKQGEKRVAYVLANDMNHVDRMLNDIQSIEPITYVELPE